MRKSITSLALAAMLAPFAAGAETPGTQDANDLKQASEAKPGPCPTEIEVLPYIWIEPTTGNEYTVLRLHCPGRDDLSDDPWSGSRDEDRGIASAVRGAS
jgi:hypothetical protein